MTIKWLPGYNPEVIAENIESMVQRGPNNQISFPGFAIEDDELVLFSALSLNQLIPEVDGRTMVTRAVVQAAQAGTVTAGTLLREIQKLHSNYKRRPLLKYVLISSVSIANNVALPSLRFDTTRIYFPSKLRSGLQKHFSEVAGIFERAHRVKLPTGYRPVQISVSARTEYDAAAIALNALDYVRGVWNLCENSKHARRISFNRREPVNRFVLGPVHTLFDGADKPVSGVYWYNPNFHSVGGTIDISRSFADYYAYLSRVRHDLKRLSYQTEIQDAFVRYAHAFDDPDLNAAFLKAWSLLELLTGTSNTNNSLTAERAAATWANPKYGLQIANHLKSYRNRSVHANASTERIEAYLYQLKTFVDYMLLLHVRGWDRFSSFSDVLNFLDLPTEKVALEKSAHLIREAMKYRRFK